jgi:hypothetical protein
MIPFHRDKLRERNALDEAEEIAEAALKTPSERLARTLELSDLVSALSRATGARALAPPSDLAEKSRLYARPLRALLRAR